MHLKFLYLYILLASIVLMYQINMHSYNIPLVADIHFAPSVAMRVAECFDKIRVNPGNFGTFSTLFLYFLSLGKKK